MNIINFKSSGLIDPRCITTIGVSVKETDNPIGFFGTGLKYAIAIILRSGGKITIWSGLEKFEFSTHQVEIRGAPIAIVTMNGAELGFTTDLGKHWEMWQAMREIYCNTMDEGGTWQEGDAEPSEGDTCVIVESAEFATTFRDRHTYILEAKPIYSGVEVSFHDRQSSGVYYKSIRVLDRITNKPFLFAPNVTRQIDLTEDRTAKDSWQIFYAIATGILKCTDRDFLTRWLTASDNHAEHTLDIDYESVKPSDEFLEVVERLAPDTSRPINFAAVKVYTRHQKAPEPIEAELMDSERAMLKTAIEFCRELQYPVDEFPITIVESLGAGVLGKADVDRRVIMLARRAIQMGDMTCASTLIEEWCHIKHGHKDCERNMQNWLFEQITTLGKAYLFEKAQK